MLRPNRIEQVIVVVLDGLRPDAIEIFGLSNLRRLMRHGAYSLEARTVTPSLTWPALTSLLTGVSPDLHGIVTDSVRLPQPRITLSPLPELLTRNGVPAAAFLRSLPAFYRMFAHRVAERLGFSAARFAGKDASEIMFGSRTVLHGQTRGLIFYHWADADAIGHTHGWMSPEYGEAARALDAALGALVSATQLESDARTLLIAVADHGGGGVDPKDHEQEHPMNVRIPVVLAGGAVVPRKLSDVSLLDVPATVAWALGVSVPRSYTGRPLVEAFALENEESAVA